MIDNQKYRSQSVNFKYLAYVYYYYLHCTRPNVHIETIMPSKPNNSLQQCST